MQIRLALEIEETDKPTFDYLQNTLDRSSAFTLPHERILFDNLKGGFLVSYDYIEKLLSTIDDIKERLKNIIGVNESNPGGRQVNGLLNEYWLAWDMIYQAFSQMQNQLSRIYFSKTHTYSDVLELNLGKLF